MMMGADYYETEAEIASLQADGDVPICVGHNTNIRIMANVVITNRDAMGIYVSANPRGAGQVGGHTLSSGCKQSPKFSNVPLIHTRFSTMLNCLAASAFTTCMAYHMTLHMMCGTTWKIKVL